MQLTQINLTITASGNYYGWSRLNLYQTNIIKTGYHGFDPTDVTKLGNDIANKIKHLNWRRVAGIAGVTLAIIGIGGATISMMGIWGLDSSIALTVMALSIADLKVASDDLWENMDEPWFYD